MYSLTVIKAVTLTLVLSNILEINGLKCYKTTGTSIGDLEVDKGKGIPTSAACASGETVCKNTTSGSKRILHSDSILKNVARIKPVTVN